MRADETAPDITAADEASALSSALFVPHPPFRPFDAAPGALPGLFAAPSFRPFAGHPAGNDACCELWR